MLIFCRPWLHWTSYTAQQMDNFLWGQYKCAFKRGLPVGVFLVLFLQFGNFGFKLPLVTVGIDLCLFAFDQLKQDIAIYLEIDVDVYRDRYRHISIVYLTYQLQFFTCNQWKLGRQLLPVRLLKSPYKYATSIHCIEGSRLHPVHLFIFFSSFASREDDEEERRSFVSPFLA